MTDVSIGTRAYSSGRAMTVLEHEYASIYPAQFTQIGDPSENPHQANIMAQIASKNFTDKGYSTTFDPIHAEAQITNAGLTDYDGICPTEAFTNSLTFNEITDDTTTLPLRPMSDNTD
ncbi:hypothetical protein QTN25_004803 [Entamoeba marina]